MTVHPRHRPNSWEQYQAIHTKKVAAYSPHFIVNDELVPQLAPSAVIWRGVLYCAGGLEIQVFKVQDLFERDDGRPAVQTVEYDYHVLQRLPKSQRNIFRYDNSHEHPGHPDEHHKHEYDDHGESIAIHLTDRGWPPGDWPTLGDVLDEVYEWWRKWAAAQSAST